MENSTSTYTDYSICVYKYNVTGQHCVGEGNIAMRQSKLLPSDVTIGYIVNKSCEVEKDQLSHTTLF